MIVLSLLIMAYGQYTIYPTVNTTFQYPLDKVFDGKGYVYDILDPVSSFSIQQAIVQGQTQPLNNIGNIIFASQSVDNSFATLSYQSDFFMASVFQVGHRGELILQLTYTINASLYTCYNLVLYRNDSVIINCIQHQTNFVTLFSFGYVNTQNITNITIKPELVKNSSISQQFNQITFSYQFEDYIDIYKCQFNQQFILSVNHHQFLNGTFLKLEQNRQGIVFGLKNDSISIYYENVTVIQAPQNMTFMDFQIKNFQWRTPYITIYLLSCHQIESLHVYRNGTYKYHSQAEFKQEYTRIFSSMNSLLLYGNKQLAYYKIDDDDQLQYYSYLNIDKKCTNLIYIWAPQVLYCVNNQQYTAFQQVAPYLYTKEGVSEKGTVKLIINDIDGNTNIITVGYIPLQPNDQGIYFQNENQDKQLFELKGRTKFAYLDLSKLIVGSNLTYSYNAKESDGQQEGYILHTNSYGTSLSQLCSIMFSQFSFSYVQACFYNEELIVEILSPQLLNINGVAYAQKIALFADITQIKISPQGFAENQIQIILHSINKIYIYTFEEFVSLNQNQIIDMTMINKSISIQDIQTLYNQIIILTQNPNRVYYTQVFNQQGVIQLQLDYSKEVLQIATNQKSYFYLLVNQVGQAQVVRFWGRAQGQGYKIIQRIKYPDGYLKCIIGPVAKGLFFYFYTETKSELYFLQREFIKQIDVQHNMFFTKVDTSGYQLVQNQLTYSYSDKFFYVVCQDNKGNLLVNIYQGSYQPIKILRSSLYIGILPKALSTTVFQDVSQNYGADLLLLPFKLGGTLRQLICHKPYLWTIPQFKWKLNQEVKIGYTINNNFTQTKVSSILSINQAYLQLVPQPKVLQSTYRIRNNQFNFNVSKMFSGPITSYQLLCDGCEIKDYQLPIDDKLDTHQLGFKSQVLKDETLYLLSSDGTLFSYDINKKTEIQTLVTGRDNHCSNIFLEINTNNPSWVCQEMFQLTFYTYNPEKKKIQFKSIEFLEFIIESSYDLGYLQFISVQNNDKPTTTTYGLIQYYIKNDILHPIQIKSINIHIFLDQTIEAIIYYFKPIILDSNSQSPIIGLVSVDSKQVQYLIIANINVNQTIVSVQPYPFTTFNTQNSFLYQPFQIGKSEIRDNYIFIKLYQCGFFNPQIFELKFYLDGTYEEQKSICHFNQLNYTNNNYRNYVGTSNYKQLIILQNNIESKQSSELLIYDLEQCGKTKLVNPYQQLLMDFNVQNFSTISYLNDNTLIYKTFGEFSLLKSTGQLTGTYKKTEEDPNISVIARNPINQASQTLSSSGNQINSSTGLAWYWIVLMVISLLVAAFFGYVFIRQRVFTRNNIPQTNQGSTYVEMR